MKKINNNLNKIKLKTIKKDIKGITLIVLVITIIIVIILSTITINAILGDNGLIKQAQTTKNQTESSITSEESENNRIFAEYSNMMEEDKEIPVAFQPVPTPEPEETIDIEFTMDYGVIEIKWLSGTSYRVSNTPNEPKINNISNGSMSLVKYDEVSQSWVEGEEYNYEKQVGSTENGGTSKWANARVTIDNIESYFVWIPRYAYRIVYFNNETSKEEYKAGNITEIEAVESGKIVGYSDSRGIVDRDGKKVSIVASTTKTMVSKDYFMAHPAFTSNVDVGGFGQELEGIWVGKYETSLVYKYTGDNINTTMDTSSSGNILLSENTDKTLAIQPNISSWVNITVGNAYSNAKYYNEELKSHLLKNSEWGAVVYLTESNYGRNGTEVTANNSSSYITGNAGDSINAEEESGVVNAYNSEKGVLASSTGNVYGIYDLYGSAQEYMAIYYNGEEANTTLIGNGSSFASIGGESNAYSTTYTGANLVENYIYGDATYETEGWHDDVNSSLVDYINIYICRGGNTTSSISGIFCCLRSSGQADRITGFRVALSVI